MATTTAEFIAFDTFKRDKINGTIDVDGDTFIVGLSTSTYVPNRSTHEILTDVTNEVSGSGYARQTLASVTLTEPTTGTWMFDSVDPVFTASGGTITARWYWVFDDTPSGPVDPLCFYGNIDDTPADVVVTDGNTLTLEVNVSGWWRYSGEET